MNVSEKMKRDWNQRALHHAQYWIATENYQTEEVFAQSGQDTAQALLGALKVLGSNSKCNTPGLDRLRCCHEKEMLHPLES
jgi:hypothetical protein